MGENLRPTSHSSENRCRDERAIKPLIDRLEDEFYKVQFAAAKALGLLNWQPVKASERAVFFIAHGNWDEVANIGVEAIEKLAIVLEHGNSSPRREAVLALKKIGGEQTVKPLVAALKDMDDKVRVTAMDALQRFSLE